MAGVLKLAQLLEHDDMAEVDVRRGRVDPELGAKWAPCGGRLLEPGGELTGGQGVDRIALQESSLRCGVSRRVKGGIGHGPNARLPHFRGPGGECLRPISAGPGTGLAPTGTLLSLRASAPPQPATS